MGGERGVGVTLLWAEKGGGCHTALWVEKRVWVEKRGVGVTLWVEKGGGCPTVVGKKGMFGDQMWKMDRRCRKWKHRRKDF